jgi:hypothetical protein
MVGINYDKTTYLLDPNTPSRPGRPLYKSNVKALVWHWPAYSRRDELPTIGGIRKHFNSDHSFTSYHLIIKDLLAAQFVPFNEQAHGNGHFTHHCNPYAIDFFGQNICDKGLQNAYTLSACMLQEENSSGAYSQQTWNTAVHMGAVICKQFGLDPILQNLMHSHIVSPERKQCPRYFYNHPYEWDRFKLAIKNRMEKIK